MLEKFAKYLAVILGPLWLPVLFIPMIYKSGLSQQQFTVIFPTVLILQLIIPLVYLIVAPKLGWISGWEMKKKEECYFHVASSHFICYHKFLENKSPH